jgi:hypothetical protein
MIRRNITPNFKVFLLISTLIMFASSVLSQTETKELVKKVSKNNLIASESKELVGDFNNDGVKDIAVIVKFSEQNAKGVDIVTTQIKTENLCGIPVPCSEDIEPESSALLILHGKIKGWDLKKTWSFKLKSSVLLRGRSNVHAFQKNQFSEKEQGIEIIKGKKGKVWLEFSTEASEGILKWKAGKYTWEETEP